MRCRLCTGEVGRVVEGDKGKALPRISSWYSFWRPTASLQGQPRKSYGCNSHSWVLESPTRQSYQYPYLRPAPALDGLADWPEQ